MARKKQLNGKQLKYIRKTATTTTTTEKKEHDPK